jgi:hypothetical protein
VVRPSRTAESRGRQNGVKNEYFKSTIIDFLCVTGFKLLSQIKGHSINELFFEVRNLCQRLPVLLLAPGVKNPSYATGEIVAEQLSICTHSSPQHYVSFTLRSMYLQGKRVQYLSYGRLGGTTCCIHYTEGWARPTTDMMDAELKSKIYDPAENRTLVK